VTAGRWLAIVIAFVVLLGIGYVTVRLGIDRQNYKEREVVLRQELQQIRDAIAAFHKAEGRYPHNLQELMPKYLRSIPRDPLTNEQDWRLVTEEDVQPNTDFTSSPTKTESFVIDVHSAARPPYSEW
jgi:sensor domain CHASE-containing protein